MAEVWKQLDFADIFARTGIAAMNFNTIFQLMRRRCEDDAALQNAETLLLMPDLGRAYKIPKVCVIEYLMGEDMCRINLS